MPSGNRMPSAGRAPDPGTDTAIVCAHGRVESHTEKSERSPMALCVLRRTVRLSTCQPRGIEMFKRISVGVDEHEGGRDARKLTHLARCPLPALPRSPRVIAAAEATEAGREPAIAAEGEHCRCGLRQQQGREA